MATSSSASARASAGRPCAAQTRTAAPRQRSRGPPVNGRRQRPRLRASARRLLNVALQGEGSGQQPRDRRCRADVAHLTRGRGRELERLDRIGQAARVEEDGALDPLGEVRLVPQLLRDRDHIGDCRDRGVSLAALGEQRGGVGQVVGPDGPPEPRRPLLARPQEVGYSAPPPQQEHHAGHRPERLQPRRSHPLSQLEHPLGRRPGLCAAKHRVPFPDRGEVPEPGRRAPAGGPEGVRSAPPGAGERRPPPRGRPRRVRSPRRPPGGVRAPPAPRRRRRRRWQRSRPSARGSRRRAGPLARGVRRLARGARGRAGWRIRGAPRAPSRRGSPLPARHRRPRHGDAGAGTAGGHPLPAGRRPLRRAGGLHGRCGPAPPGRRTPPGRRSLPPDRHRRLRGLVAHSRPYGRGRRAVGRRESGCGGER